VIGDFDTVLHADVLLSYVRRDGMTVNLHRADGYHHVAVWMPGNRLVRPIDTGLMGEVPATMFLRRCAEPVSIPSALAEDIRALLTGMRGVKATERAMFDRAIADGAASLLMVGALLFAFDPALALIPVGVAVLHGGVAAILFRSLRRAAAAEVDGVRAKALAELPATLRADLDAIVAAQKARNAQRKAAS
jgi:hypothetical protein